MASRKLDKSTHKPASFARLGAGSVTREVAREHSRAALTLLVVCNYHNEGAHRPLQHDGGIGVPG